VRFEWDRNKAEANNKKHKVSFEEATSVFRDPLALIFDDADHSREERREIIIGHSILKHLVLVCFTERGRDTIRVVSARMATRRERQDYEKNASRKSR
jgi:uncharacterized DUF497 family protein